MLRLTTWIIPVIFQEQERGKNENAEEKIPLSSFRKSNQAERKIQEGEREG